MSIVVHRRASGPRRTVQPLMAAVTLDKAVYSLAWICDNDRRRPRSICKGAWTRGTANTLWFRARGLFPTQHLSLPSLISTSGQTWCTWPELSSERTLRGGLCRTCWHSCHPCDSLAGSSGREHTARGIWTHKRSVSTVGWPTTWAAATIGQAPAVALGDWALQSWSRGSRCRARKPTVSDSRHGCGPAPCRGRLASAAPPIAVPLDLAKLGIA